jgi:hypothetical protein
MLVLHAKIHACPQDLPDRMARPSRRIVGVLSAFRTYGRAGRPRSTRYCQMLARAALTVKSGVL